jgi:hypothetical protein
VPKGRYIVVVGRVRPLARFRILALTLSILEGSLAGRVAQVRLYVPAGGDRLAAHHFRTKIAGFGDLSEVRGEMASIDPDGRNFKGALAVLAGALEGRIAVAEIDVLPPSDRWGKGNELISTEPVVLKGGLQLGSKSTA